MKGVDAHSCKKRLKKWARRQEMGKVRAWNTSPIPVISRKWNGE